MRKTFRSGHWFAAAAIGAFVAFAPHAQAQDFFGSFFDALSGRPSPPAQRALNYGASDTSIFPPEQAAPPPPRASAGRSTAYCVRTCDGRYFPISAANEKAHATNCDSLCPASETKVFYGSSIEHATAGGKPYSSLPNAFKYREQLVPTCTCNGKDPVGLAKIDIENDSTIRKGDLVASENGLTVATTTAGRKGAVANFSPAPQRIRAQFERAAALATR